MSNPSNFSFVLQDSLWEDPKLLLFVKLLKAWSQQTNLISAHDLKGDFMRRHIKDCGGLLPFVQDWPSLVDIGTGAGLPGIVLSILAKKHVHLVESRLKKVLFLKEAKRTLDLNVTVHHGRLEEMPPFQTPFFVSRAFRSLDDTLQLLRPHLTKETAYVCLKGESAMDEVAKARVHFAFDLEVFSSLTHAEGKVLRLHHIEPK